MISLVNNNDEIIQIKRTSHKAMDVLFYKLCII